MKSVTQQIGKRTVTKMNNRLQIHFSETKVLNFTIIPYAQWMKTVSSELFFYKPT